MPRKALQIAAAAGYLFAVFHLMITGRFKWRRPGSAIPRKGAHAAFDFPTGTLLLTEAGTKKRASLFVVRGREGLSAHDPGGLEVPDADLSTFKEAILRENRTLKRALTDPRIAALYDAVVTVTRGPLFSRRRLVEIWKLNTGAYEIPR